MLSVRHSGQGVSWRGTRTRRQPSLREIRAIAVGDSAAFQRLIEREAPTLLRFARAHTRQSRGGRGRRAGHADPALGERRGAGRPDARIGTWLHRVCYNRSIDLLRRRATSSTTASLEEFPDQAEPAEAKASSQAKRCFRSAMPSKCCRRGSAPRSCSSTFRTLRSARRPRSWESARRRSSRYWRGHGGS